MVTSLLLLLACCAGWTMAACSSIDGAQCDGFGGMMTETCVVPVRSGQGKTWIEASRDCEAGGGRLLWTSSRPLLILFTRLDNVNKFNLVYVSLMVSVADDSSSFWKPSLEDNQFTCGSKQTHTCTTKATVDNSTCLDVGCCLKEGQCMYPDVQNMTLSDASVDTSALQTPHIRSCAGLRLLGNSSYVYEAFDCFKPGDNNTAYICQFKCFGTSWKEINKKTLVIAQELSEDQPLPWAVIGGAAAGAVVLIWGAILAGLCIYKKKSGKNRKPVSL